MHNNSHHTHRTGTGTQAHSQHTRQVHQLEPSLPWATHNMRSMFYKIRKLDTLKDGP
jgi:hypothetical protein